MSGLKIGWSEVSITPEKKVRLQLCYGASGYLPTETAERGSHYSAYVSSGITGHIGGEQLVRKTLEELNRM